MLINAAETLAEDVGVAPACESIGLARSTLYHMRSQKQGAKKEPKSRPSPARKLGEKEKQQVLDMLHCERFVDKAPAEIWATLLDEGIYLCSERTMYRILESEKEVKERRNQRNHPEYKKPELPAEAANQVWSWDITKLKGPVKWTYF
jgi:putative transposase